MILYFWNVFYSKIECLNYTTYLKKVISDKTTEAEKGKCTEIAANIAVDTLKLESEELELDKYQKQITTESNKDKER